MKKLYLGLLASVAMLTTSCDMDTTNYGVIDQSNYIETMSDCQAFVNGMYVHMRGKTGDYYMFYPDVQMDQFIGVVDNGNRGGIMQTGQLRPGDTDLADIYEAMYVAVNDANFFIPRVEKLIESGDFSEAEVALLKYYKGTAHFERAYAYWYLFDKYVRYDASQLEAPGKGLQIQKVFAPSGNRKEYVGRSTIKETVEYITEQLSEAYALMKEYETNVSSEYCNPNSARLSSNVVAALWARFALLCEDYKTAGEKAEIVINSEKYVLTPHDKYVAMWTNDEGSELLFVPWAEQGNGGQAIGVNYLRNNQKVTSDYIPTVDALLAYEDGDIRFDAFFELYNPMTIQGEDYIAYAFNKFPGNPALNTGTSNALLNKSKPFRLSEQYLIAAEAYSAPGNLNETKANQYLNELRAARIEGYEEETLSGNALVTAVREERGKELIGEGFRLSDLRRWGKGMTREAGYEQFEGTSLAPLSYIMDGLGAQYNNIHYDADDYRFIWPIPTREMQVNPQLKNQQNPHY